MERYEKYKDSGVEWIGEIPAGWEVRRIKNTVMRKSESGHADETVLSLYRDYGVVVKDSRDDNFNKTSENTDAYRFVEKDDLVVNKMKAWQGSLAVSGFRGIVSPAYYVYRISSSSVIPRYMHYQLRDVSYLPEYRRLSGGIRPGQWDLSSDNFVNIPMLIPSLQEQQAIADYLDEKTAEIDGLVADCEREVELLQEYRKAVISEAVTKGLDPNAPMKDSGIEWIGQIPEEWEMGSLRRCITRTGNGITRRGEYDENGALVLKLRNINNGAIDYGFQNRMQLSEQELESFRLDIGDFLFVRVNGSRDLVGKSAIYEGFIGDVAYNDHIIRITFDDHFCNPRFMLWYLQSEVSRHEIDMRVKTSAGQFTVSGDDIKECLLIMPPLKEQKAIADYLDAKTAEIDALIEAKQAMADKLREYRKSLISEAVTGKFKVPGV